MAKNEPVCKFRLSRISVAVWENVSGDGATWYRVSITRCWKDGDEWRETTSFDSEDLPIVAEAAMLAHSWIWEQQVSRCREKVEQAA